MAERTLQFKLSTLFVLVTGCGLFFAYPALCIGCLLLLAGSLAVLAVFIVGVFLPIYLLASWLTRDPKHGEQESANRERRSEVD